MISHKYNFPLQPKKLRSCILRALGDTDAVDDVFVKHFLPLECPATIFAAVHLFIDMRFQKVAVIQAPQSAQIFTWDFPYLAPHSDNVSLSKCAKMKTLKQRCKTMLAKS